jgi:hydrogenase nickel incorporation protein HypA/HybF
MHELSVCNALLDQVESIAREHLAPRVSRITLGIGPLSGVEADLLRRAFPLAAAGTVAAEAELVIEQAEIVVRCSECDAQSTVPPNRLLCTRCGDFRTRIVSGDELILRRVELENAVARATPALATI